MDQTSEQDRRKHPRFSDRILAGAKVEMAPCPPLFGEALSGYLVDLSAGGMAILIPDIIPKKVFLRMKMILPDGFLLESVVQVRRVVREGRASDFLHGIEFLNPSPEMIEHIHRMAQDILACNARTQSQAPEICVAACQLRLICKRPQCVAKNIRPALIKFTEELKRVA